MGVQGAAGTVAEGCCATSGQPVVGEATPDVAVEVGALGVGGDQALEDGLRDGEVAVDRATVELQFESCVEGVADRREQ